MYRIETTDSALSTDIFGLKTKHGGGGGGGVSHLYTILPYRQRYVTNAFGSFCAVESVDVVAKNGLNEFCVFGNLFQALETAEENVRRLANNLTVELPHPDLCDVKKEKHESCPNCQVSFLICL